MRIRRDSLTRVLRVGVSTAGFLWLAVLLAGPAALGQQTAPPLTLGATGNSSAGVGPAFGNSPSSQQTPASQQPLGGGFGVAGSSAGPASFFSAPYPEYRIGPHDLLQVSVYEAPEFSRSVRVSRDGTVLLPICKKPVSVNGLTYVGAELAIAQGLVDEGLLVAPVVSVLVREPHGNPVRVTGSVRQPVVFSAIGPTTLLDAIGQAGGLQNPGAQIVVTRTAKGGSRPETLHIPTSEFAAGVNGAQELPLYGGETVRVVQPEKVFVMGAIGKPGTIDITEADGMEFLQLLAAAGGTTKHSNNKAIILRSRPGFPGEKDRIVANVKKILKFEVLDLRAQPGDVISRISFLAVLERIR